MECEHEFTAKVVPAELFENGETAQFVIIRGAATTTITTTRRSSRGANCPDRLKRGHEAKQEVRSRLRVVYSAKNGKQLHGNDNGGQLDSDATRRSRHLTGNLVRWNTSIRMS